MNIVLIILFLLPVWRALARDYQKGLALALVLFTLMTDSLAIDVGAFQFTFHRILLILVFVFWVRQAGLRHPLSSVPFLPLVLVWWGATLGSLAFAKDYGLSTKAFISFSTEVVLFYIMVSTSLTDRAAILGGLRALCVGAGIVAALGAVEYYTLFNPFIKWMGVTLENDQDNILVSFRHRILLGNAMAMGWPLLLALGQDVKGFAKSALATVAILLMFATCYFSNSRGPWLGCAVAGVVMYGFGSGRVRKQIQVFVLLTGLVLIARPGVRATLDDLVMSTFDPTSYRGESYTYRKLLWPIAFELVGTSPARTLFGYGGGSIETMDLQSKLPFGGSTKKMGSTSWDNNYAADLVEFGWIGLALEMTLYVAILIRLGRLSLQCPPADRDKAAAVLAGAMVYALALSNVYVFSPQLKFMFFTLVAIGTRLPLLIGQEEHQETAVTSEPVDQPSVAGAPS
jgi:hypothetical protein